LVAELHFTEYAMTRLKCAAQQSTANR